MKIPGAEYDRPVQGFQRESVEAPLAVASARVGAASARGYLSEAFNRMSGVAEAWYIADEKTKAAKALGEYSLAVANAKTLLTNSPAMKASSVPEGVQFKRTETVNGEERDRESVPSWEVAPGYFDYIEKEARRDALSRVGNKHVRDELSAHLNTTRTSNFEPVAAFAMKGQKAEFAGRVEEAIHLNTDALNLPGALAAVDTGLQAGIMTPKEGEDRKQKIKNDFENLKWGDEIAKSEDPAFLRTLGDQILRVPGPLTDEQRLGKSRQATAKANQLETAQLRIIERADREKSKEYLGTVAEAIRIDKFKPSKLDIEQAKKALTPTDFLSYLSLVERHNKTGGVDKGTVADLSRQMVSITMADAQNPDWSMDRAAQQFQRNVDAALVAGKIDHKTWDQFQQDARQQQDRATKGNPQYVQGMKTLSVSIAQVYPGTFIAPGGDTTRFSVAQEAQAQLAREVMKNPKLNIQAWVDENLPTFKFKANSAVLTKLEKMPAVRPFIAYKQGGAFDPDGTWLKLKEAHLAKKIDDEAFKRGVDMLGAPATSGGTAITTD